MLYIIWISFRLRNVEQKFVQNEMRLESTGQNYLSCAAIHSTAYCLNASYSLLPQCILHPTASMHSTTHCLNAFYSLLPQCILQPTASVHSTTYCLNAFYSLLPAVWFPSGLRKNSRGAFKDRRVSVYR